MSFGQGLSGLKAASQTLDVIGNNIANSGTVGFKAGTATFADVYANSRVGLGTQVSSINQRFTIGSISGTGNQFDMAIDGAKGMFRLEDPSGNVLYSRNGQFFADKDNNIVNAQGHRLTGYLDAGTNAVPLKVPTGNIDPVATKGVTTKANLDANAKVVPNAAPTLFSHTDPTTYTHSLPINVYDSLGNSHQLTQYFIKRAGTPAADPTVSNWDVRYRLGNQDIADVGDPSTPATSKLTFDQAGSMTGTTSVTLAIPNPGGTSGSPAQPLSIAINYAGSTQFGGPFSPNFTQNGYATGEYASMSVAADGSIWASYTNGEMAQVGTLALAHFNNLQGLQPVGGNAWAETATSGQPILGRPGENSMAMIKGQAVEESNVDMSQELVNMIIAQRTYQANAQTIKTQDQIMQTLISMR